MAKKIGRPKEDPCKKVNLDDLTDFALKGMTELQLSAALKISLRTLQSYKTSPVFLARLKKGKDTADQQVVASLWKRALGYDIKESHWDPKSNKIVETSKHYPPETLACIFWLKNRQSLDWRDRAELTGKDGAPFEVRIVYAD